MTIKEVVGSVFRVRPLKDNRNALLVAIYNIMPNVWRKHHTPQTRTSSSKRQAFRNNMLWKLFLRASNIVVIVAISGLAPLAKQCLLLCDARCPHHPIYRYYYTVDNG